MIVFYCIHDFEANLPEQCLECNSIAELNNHRSSGTIYSQGYTAKYDKVGNDLLSFNKFARKNNKKTKSNTELNIEHHNIETKIYKYLYGSMVECSRICHNIFEEISPKINKLQYHFNLQFNEEEDFLKRFTQSGMLNAHICINAMTEDCHTEKDSSYTLISVPNQEDRYYQQLDPKFMFHINDNFTIQIKMVEGTVMIYSGYTLNHHQMLNKNNLSRNTFINLASYGNRRLFQNMLKSFERTTDISDTV